MIDACRGLAYAEDTLVFTGNASSAGIVGIATASSHPAVTLSDEFDRYPNQVAGAVASLKAAGIDGPYALALGPRCYAGVIETTEKGGYPLLQHLGLILGGPVDVGPGGRRRDR